MDPDDAVLLTDVVPTGYQAARWAGIQRGDTVVVFGAGPVGIMAARCAWLFGAGRVIVIDCLDYRLEFARNYAPCEAYNFRSLDDPVVFLKRTTDSLGADVCIDAVGAEAAGSAMQTILGRKLLLQGGSATALHWAINSVKKGGIVSIVGVYGPIDTLVPIGNVVNKGLTLRANQASVKRLLPRLIEHVQNGILDPKALITHRIPLEYVSDAYRIFSAKLDGCIKPVLMPPSVRNLKRNRPWRIPSSTPRRSGLGRGRRSEERPDLPHEAAQLRGSTRATAGSVRLSSRSASRSCIPTSARTSRPYSGHRRPLGAQRHDPPLRFPL
jgi:threonine dehydrogenase-like Zn-dependent dehydrogenase